MGCRILLADESLNAQRLWAQYLVELGYDVTAVSSGAAALARLQDLHPHLVIADSGLSGMSGRELCAVLGQHPEWGRIPLILTLKAFDQGTEEELRAAGASAVLRKPFSPALLEKIVTELVATSSVPEFLAPPQASPEKTVQGERRPEATAMETAAETSASPEPAHEQEAVPEPEAAPVLEPMPVAPVEVPAETPVMESAAEPAAAADAGPIIEESLVEEPWAPVEEEPSTPVAATADAEEAGTVGAIGAVASAEPVVEMAMEAAAEPVLPPVTAAEMEAPGSEPASSPAVPGAGIAAVPDLLSLALEEASWTAPAAAGLPAPMDAVDAPRRLRQILQQFLSPALAEQAAAKIEHSLTITAGPGAARD